jgi:NADH-quinone oxidoreductase subunit J
MMTDVLLFTFMAAAVLATTLMLFTRNIMYVVIGLIITLMSLAGIYVLYGAEFVAVAQLMIYIGGVIVLLLFAVMLTQRVKGRVLQTGVTQRFIAPLLAAVFFVMLLPLFKFFPSGISNSLPPDPIKSLGFRLLTHHVIILEIVALLLLVVLIGAASIAGHFYIIKKRRR